MIRTIIIMLLMSLLLSGCLGRHRGGLRGGHCSITPNTNINTSHDIVKS